MPSRSTSGRERGGQRVAGGIVGNERHDDAALAAFVERLLELAVVDRSLGGFALDAEVLVLQVAGQEGGKRPLAVVFHGERAFPDDHLIERGEADESAQDDERVVAALDLAEALDAAHGHRIARTAR